MFASRDTSTAFSGIHGPGLTCLEFLHLMGVCVCQTHSQLSLYIYPKLVYSRINQTLMSYALSCPCNSMHNFLLCSNTSQLSVGAVTVPCHCCRWKTLFVLCEMQEHLLLFCFLLLFSPLSLLLLQTLAFLTPTGNKHTSATSLWCSLQACSTEQGRDLGGGILRQQKSDINQSRER